LKQNIGKDIYCDVFVEETKGQWRRFETISNHIAVEKIDDYLVYRLINPGRILWDQLGIYYRNIQNFKEKRILVNSIVDKDCMNCHSFCLNDPDKMIFHIRGKLGGTILINEKQIKKINTATNYTISAGAYPAWHPGGKFIAFSVNKISQYFHAVSNKKIEVHDSYSDLILYDIEANMDTTSPKISTKKRETMPTWSPDGKYLYFCAAPEFKKDIRYDSVKYSLYRITYEIDSAEWGEIDTILTPRETGLSIAWPRISPDGRYLLFCMAKHGYFTIHYPSSDLYLMDLKTMEYKRLDINSDQTESFHSWSKNSRWFVFSSKRRNGLNARPYFSYIDKNGIVYKPFLLPQKDPGFYDTYLMNYNVPEMVSGSFNFDKWDLTKAVRKKAINATFDTSVNIDALSGATRIRLQKDTILSESSLKK